jgi:hypothetical protein
MTYTDKDRIVISYFPGAGGNRLAGYLFGYAWQVNLRGHFHNSPHKQHIVNHTRNENTYLRWSTQIESSDYPVEITHCVCTALIQHHYPGRKIIKIKSDLSLCLERQWRVWTRFNLYQAELRRGQIDTALSDYIKSHQNYYRDTDIDWSADELYDIDNDDNEFCTVMRDTLSRWRDQDFRSHWDRTFSSFKL